ncbi:MAG: DUF192 domain-containing protein [Patescibacteria group bacterium]|jgi:uncharacterized membrane protein (UPF0127 family)
MVKSIPIILTVFVLLFAAYFFFFKKTSPPGTVNLEIKNKSYSLEIAKTLTQKSQGLSNRDSLCNNCGMIFVYDKESIYPFWMKDTLIPLDMIWVDRQGRVVTIHTAKPQTNTPITQLKVYKNEIPAQYIIELNANEAQKIGLEIGDTINIDL